MIVELCSVRDLLTGFAAPSIEFSVESARRSFSDAIRDNKHLGDHIHDFALYRLGSFDSDDGRILVPDTPELICSAFDVCGGEDRA